jgi:hypothetical protein
MIPNPSQTDINADAGVIQARRILDRLYQEEQAANATVAAALWTGTGPAFVPDGTKRLGGEQFYTDASCPIPLGPLASVGVRGLQ